MCCEAWIVDLERTFNNSFVKNFEGDTRVNITMLSANHSETALNKRLHKITKSEETDGVPIFILLDSRLTKKVVENAMEWRKSLIWPDRKYVRSPMIDFFVPPPQVPGDARKSWTGVLENYPDDYHFYTVEQLRSEIVALTNRSKIRRLYAEHGMVMSSNSPLQEIKKYVDKLADTGTNVRITGETGTGKELIARALHFRGKRSRAPFVPVTCSAIPPELFESELFGYKKGAFTGAIRDHKGYIQQADKGTLFLDEVGDMPLLMQVKLLRVLQEREVTPLGSTEAIKVDIRVVSATLKNLEEEAEKGNFRQDLLYRLSGWPIELPPLRERGRDDLVMLIEHFLFENAPRAGSTYKNIDSQAMQALLDYSWSGNVRELDQVIERALISCDIREKEQIDIEDLPPQFKQDTKKMEETPRQFPVNPSSNKIQRQLNPHNESELTRDHYDQIKLAIDMCKGKLGKKLEDLFKEAGFERGASRGRLRNLLGLTKTKHSADPELSQWFAQKYPNKMKHSS